MPDMQIEGSKKDRSVINKYKKLVVSIRQKLVSIRQ